MAFWCGIFFGGAFAWFAIQKGFYETWAILFNLVIAIYLAIFLGPVIAGITPAGGTPYSTLLAIIVTAAAAFAILHGITFVFFTGQFTVSFPKVFDILGSGLLGFLAGFLIWSFISLLLLLTPISQNKFVKEFGFAAQFQEANVPYISRWCNFVNNLVAYPDNKYTAEQAIDKILKTAGKKKTPPKKTTTTPQTEPNEPNDIKTPTTRQNQPPPTQQ